MLPPPLDAQGITNSGLNGRLIRRFCRGLIPRALYVGWCAPYLGVEGSWGRDVEKGRGEGTWERDVGKGLGDGTRGRGVGKGLGVCVCPKTD